MVKDRKLDFFYFTKKAKAAFKKLKERFQSASIFRLYNPKLLIRLEINISKFAIKIIISQLFLTKIINEKNNIRLYFDREN
jgi:hypothetical protein